MPRTKRHRTSILHKQASLLLGCLLLAFGGWTQGLKASQWRFGYGCGLDFSSGSPQVITPVHPMLSVDGSSSMADDSGNLLFYSHGESIWNKNDATMPNGTGLSSSNSLTQVVVLEKPNSSSEYYLITPDFGIGLNYTLIDMTLDNGLGDVVAGQKNVIIEPALQKEMVTAVNHENDTDTWVIFTKNGPLEADTLCATLLTAAGFVSAVLKQPIPYEIFSAQAGNRAGMKVSPNGAWVALSASSNANLETHVYPFNQITGAFGTPIILPQLGRVPEFSCDGNLLYLVNSAQLYQYDLSSGIEQNILNSETLISTWSSNLIQFESALQLGPNGKIYVGHPFDSMLSVINAPRAPGTNCSFQFKSQGMGSSLLNTGLCSFNQSLMQCNGIGDSVLCANDTSYFYVRGLHNFDSVAWNFGDPASGAHNTQTGFHATHVYQTTGSKLVRMITYTLGQTDTLEKTIEVNFPPTITVPPDTALCVGESLLIFPEMQHVNQFQWSTTTGTTLLVGYPGNTYTLSVTNSCSTDTASIVLDAIPVPAIDLGPDSILCIGDSHLLQASNTLATNLWSDGSTADAFWVLQSGSYWLQHNHVCGTFSDSIVFQPDTMPVVQILNDSVICQDEFVHYTIGNPNETSFLWQDGTVGNNFQLTASGTVWLEVSNSCGVSADTLHVQNLLPVDVSLGPDTTLCPEQILTLSVPAGFHALTWQDGSSSNQFSVDSAGVYWINGSNPCGVLADTIVVHYDPMPQVQLDSDTVICRGDSIWLQPRFNISNLRWEDGFAGSNRWVSETGNYTVEVSNRCATASASFFLQTQHPGPVTLGQDRTICAGETLLLEAPGSQGQIEWLNGSREQTQIATEPGQYGFFVQDSLGCTDSTSVQLSPCASIWVPNAFTPRGDGLNDVFKPIGEGVDEYRFRIYNRWGQLLFNTNELTEGWNGRIAGQEAPVGGYTWEVFYVDRYRREKIMAGGFHLIR